MDFIENVSFGKYVNNNIFNVLLNLKKEKALDNNIDIKYDINNSLDFMNEIDLINLFSNILDNAIRCSSNGYIYLFIGKKMDNIIIQCRNSITMEVHGTGYGSKIIDDILKKYDGTKKIKDNKKTYEIIILIPFN